MSEPLEAWREELHPVLKRLRAFDLPADFPFDFSAASLRRLEAVLLDRFPRGGAAVAPAGDLIESVLGYVGEALLRAGGGGWVWDADADVPVVKLDEGLTLPVISPLRLIIDAVDRRTGTEFATAHDRVRVAVERHQARHPGWRPVKEPTPGWDADPQPPVPPWLENWLAQRETAFPAWAADAPGKWDFSPASLTTLEALVRDRLPTDDAFTEPGNLDFVEGCTWYLGEVLRRNKRAARWRYNRAEPGSTDIRLSPEMNPWVGRPFIEQAIPDGNATVPIFDLQFAVAEPNPGYLAERLATLSD